jgi:hypothetical protein
MYLDYPSFRPAEGEKGTGKKIRKILTKSPGPGIIYF